MNSNENFDNNSIAAGPYELFHQDNPKSKVTLCITDKNFLSVRIYDGAKI
jgi:hypothetical protein